MWRSDSDKNIIWVRRNWKQLTRTHVHADEERQKAWVRRAREGVIREMEASAGMEGFGDSLIGEEVYAPQDWRNR